MKRLMIVLSVLFVLVGCSTTAEGSTIEIVHKLGTTKVKQNPEKVVVFDMGILDILDQHKITVSALPKSSLPERLNKYDSKDYVDAGTLFEPNYESLAILQPDVIIISGRSSKHFESLSDIAPTIYLGTGSVEGTLLDSIEFNVQTLELIYPNISIKQSFNDVKEKINDISTINTSSFNKTLFLLVNGDSVSSYGPGSRYDHVYNEFGFKSVDYDFEASSHGDKISLELVSSLNPDNIIVLDRGSITGEEKSAEQIMQNEFVKDTNAYKNSKIIYVKAQEWYLIEGGLNSLSLAADELKSLLD